jgi:parvulin-like peptidyl-prolyl isomerase
VTIPKKIAVSVLLIVGAAACSQTFGQTAAVVNGHRITVDDLNDQIKLLSTRGGSQTGDVTTQALLTLIQTELVRETGVKRHIAPTEREVDAKVAQVRAENGIPDDATFQQQLKAAGFTLATYREQVKLELIQEALQKQLAPAVSDADVRTVYKQERAQFREIKVKHILYSTQSQTAAQALAKANDALARIKAGADFDAIAKKESDDTGSKAAGGLLSKDWVQLSQLDATFGDAAWTAKINVVAGPVQTQFGYHLILTLAKRIQPFSEVQTLIKQQLESQAGQSALTDFATKLVGAAHIKVNPRYGDWDAKQGTIVAHQFFRPAVRLSPSPTAEPSLSIEPLPS